MLPSGCLFTILLLTCFHYAHPKNAHSSKDHHWDVLIFAQQWPMTACEQWKAKNPTHKCKMPSVSNSWSIHGIWPSKFGTLGPNFCNSSAHFDPEAVKPIERELTDVWTNIKYGTSQYSLWAHEWTKHGTCAAETLETFNTDLKYITRGLEYYKTYNLSNILREADIVPSLNKGYDVVDIVTAVRVHLGINPVVKCRTLSGQSHLVEIRICFGKDLKLRDCDGVVFRVPYLKGKNGNLIFYGTSDNVLTNCKRTQPVMYLPYSVGQNFVN